MDPFTLADLSDSKDLSRLTDYTGHSLLHWAVYNEDLEMCQFLLSKEYFIDVQDSLGTTPLMIASSLGFKDILNLLLENGADPEKTNNFGADALTMAGASDNVEIMQILSSFYERRIQNENVKQLSHNVIIISAACGSEKSIEFLCNETIYAINVENEGSGLSALAVAEIGGFKYIEEKLLSRGAERNPLIKQSLLQNSTLLPQTPSQGKSFLFPLSPCCSPCCSNHGSTYSPRMSPANSPFSTNKYLHLNPSSLLSSETNPNYSERKFPLTPNLCFSPQKRRNKSPYDRKISVHSWFKKLKRKRSKSTENIKLKKRKGNAVETDNILDYILSSSKLSEYKQCFTDHEVTFRTFITLNEDELMEVGVKKRKDRKKLVNLINHYKRIFFSQNSFIEN